MTTTNHLPDPSPEASLHVTLPSVEWMPLDGLIQSWAAFAQETTNACALRALSAAFAALEQESMARRYALTVSDDRWPASVPDAVSAALSRLAQAATSWLAALDELDTYRRAGPPAEEAFDEQAVLALFAESYQQLLSVACLSVRLVQEMGRAFDAPLRLVIGTLPALTRREAI